MAVITKVEAVVNSQTYLLTESGGTWTATPTAPTQTSGSNNNGQGPGVGAEARDKGYYPVILRVYDDYGNITEVTPDDTVWGEVLKLKVMERTAPVATLQYPNDGALIRSSRPTVQFKVTDSGSGPKPTECYVIIDNGAPVRVTGSSDGTTCTVSYTPSSNLDDGDHTISIYGYDFDVNKSNEVSAGFTIDTTPPVLNVTNPESEVTKINKTVINVIGTTNDEVSSPVTVTITGGAQDYNPLVSNGAFNQAVALKENATNDLVITATDSAGLSTVVKRKVIVNTIPPTITDIALTPNPVDGGKTLTISLTARPA